MVNKLCIHSTCFHSVADIFSNCFCWCSDDSFSCCCSCSLVSLSCCCWRSIESCSWPCSCSTVSWRRDTNVVNTLTSLSPSSWQWPVVHWHTTGAGWTTKATTTTASSETGHTDVHIAAKLWLTVSSPSNTCLNNVTNNLHFSLVNSCGKIAVTFLFWWTVTTVCLSTSCQKLLIRMYSVQCIHCVWIGIYHCTL